MRYFHIVIAYFCILFLECTNSPQDASPSPRKSAIQNPRNDEASIYALRTEKTDAYSVNKPSSFFLTLTPRGVYHINQEYPTSVTVAAPAEIAVTKSKLLKSDAMRFDEKLAKFEVAFSPNKSGTYPLDLKASFAMCTAERCIPFDKTLAVTLFVK